MTNFTTPVLLLLFNRPQYTQEVLQALAQVRPRTLYVALDGPRPGIDQDKAGIEACVNLVNQLDWPCQIHILKRDENLGCGLAVSQAIDWFFANEAMGIILEDDCVPAPAFFTYCQEMLAKYKHDSRIMHIAGTRWNEEFAIAEPYFFTAIGHVWGWATWRRAWQRYDYHMHNWPALQQTSFIREVFPRQKHVAFWEAMFNEVYNQSAKHTWDYQWQYTLFVSRGLAVTPRENLVQNIGATGVHDDQFEPWRHRRSVNHSFRVSGYQVPVRLHPYFDGYNMDHYFLRKDPIWIRAMRRVQRLPGFKLTLP
ncbi:nucleotide-diphospho-sugar transferase [Spirosoma taeanense]|uniref:Nucleotide-diphospho-sugar transferase n=1 Tax=Spirosoma taeanense TaxID=2735870 RepID=A0A6M5XZK0_9BACT|nr:nucleotide-diphospho-sugar transferase [Spirosoma taeanense]QJW87997.1 nucleotide-diphospho-sugar transferase [Spirosoma taeanense]